MNVRLKKHMNINGNQMLTGSTLPLSVLDKLMDDGRVVYHHPERNTFEILPADSIVVVYDSPNEMEMAKELDKRRAEVLKEQKRYK